MLPCIPIELRESVVVKLGLKACHAEIWHYKWRGLQNRSKHRGIRCPLTFQDFLKLALKAGLTSPHQIGKSVKHYNLARLGDTGPYKIGNCRFVLSNVNRDERVSNGRTKIAAAKMRGRTKDTCSGLASAAVKRSKQFKVISPDGKIYIGRNLKMFCARHHVNQGNLAKVCRGEKPQTAGWKGSYV